MLFVVVVWQTALLVPRMELFVVVETTLFLQLTTGHQLVGKITPLVTLMPWLTGFMPPQTASANVPTAEGDMTRPRAPPKNPTLLSGILRQMTQ